MENRIKEQLTLFVERVSAETMRANQLRLYLSAMACLLVCGLRRLGLRATEMATAQVATIRTRLLKIGAQVRITARKDLDLDGLRLSLAGLAPGGLLPTCAAEATNGRYRRARRKNELRIRGVVCSDANSDTVFAR